MGSLQWAGAIGGAGAGLQAHAEERATTRRQDDEQAHQIQLQTMRDKAAEERATQREKFEVDQAEVKSQHELGMAKTLREHQETLQTTELASLEWRKYVDRETSIDVALINAAGKRGGAGLGAGRYSAFGWDLYFTDPTMDMATGQTIPGTIIAHREGDPTPWQMRGNMMIRDGTPLTDVRPIEDLDKRHYVEDKFIAENLGDPAAEEEFIRDYGYLPTRYMIEMTYDENEDLVGWLGDNRASFPIYSEAVRKRLGISPDKWAIPEAGVGGVGGVIRPSQRRKREYKVTVPTPEEREPWTSERVRREYGLREPAVPEILDPAARMVRPAGAIRRGAEEYVGKPARAVGGAMGEAGRAVGGAWLKAGQAIAEAFAPAEYEGEQEEQ